MERLLAQKFNRGAILPFSAPSATLLEALNRPRPILYLRLSDHPFEDLI